MNVLALIQTFTDKLGLPRPSALISATDKSSRNYQALLRETVADLGEYRWQQQRVRGTFTSVNAELQGKLTTLVGAGYAGLVKDSIWNDTQHMQISGPLTDQEWQNLKAFGVAGPEWKLWISRDQVYLNPIPPAGDTISFIYVTKYNVVAADGVTYKEFITADDDSVVFPDNCVLRLFEAKWRKSKGEGGWEDDYNDAMSLIAKNIVRDAGGKLQLDGTSIQRPGIIIPSGNWPHV